MFGMGTGVAPGALPRRARVRVVEPPCAGGGRGVAGMGVAASFRERRAALGAAGRRRGKPVGLLVPLG